MVELVENPLRAGTFALADAFAEDSDRVGTFDTSVWIVENPDRLGTFMTYTPYVAPTDPLTSDRTPYRRYELLEADMVGASELDGITGAQLRESAQAVIKRGGQAAITDMGLDVDWLTARVRCLYGIEGHAEWGLGVYLVSTPTATWSDGIRRWDAELLDIASVLAETRIEDFYYVDAGTVVTDEIKALIESTGESSASVTDSTKTLTEPLVWEPGTPVLTIINALADAIGYFALASDRDGALRVEPYVRPAARPVAWEFVDGITCVYRPEFTVSQDLYGIPNHQHARTPGTGDTPALYVNVYNDDPASRFSRANRGRTISAEPIEVEATDLDALTTAARRALLEATEPTREIVIDAMPLPLSANDVARFRSAPAGIDGRFVIAGIQHGDNELAMSRYTLREVIDL